MRYGSTMERASKPLYDWGFANAKKIEPVGQLPTVGPRPPVTARPALQVDENGTPKSGQDDLLAAVAPTASESQSKWLHGGNRVGGVHRARSGGGPGVRAVAFASAVGLVALVLLPVKVGQEVRIVVGALRAELASRRRLPSRRLFERWGRPKKNHKTAPPIHKITIKKIHSAFGGERTSSRGAVMASIRA